MVIVIKAPPEIIPTTEGKGFREQEWRHTSLSVDIFPIFFWCFTFRCREIAAMPSTAYFPQLLLRNRVSLCCSINQNITMSFTESYSANFQHDQTPTDQLLLHSDLIPTFPFTFSAFSCTWQFQHVFAACRFLLLCALRHRKMSWVEPGR